MIDHFDLLGLKQIYANLKNRKATQVGFMKAGLYRLVRHPIMTGFLVAFWAAPIMTVGHLLFSVVTTGYIIIAVLRLEEKDLIAQIGDDYIAYQREVPAFIPSIGRGR
jgi:protein-S-isoprenylcysteine O-methyltransferase Ste14